MCYKNDVQTNSTYEFGGKINQVCILEPSKYFIKRRLSWIGQVTLSTIKSTKLRG